MSAATYKYFWGNTFLKAPLQNGCGRYVQQLQRVTLKFCKSNGSSLGMREFIEKDLILFAKENPGVVIYVKPRRHRNAAIVAEYICGEEMQVFVKKLTRGDIAKYMEQVRTRAYGETKKLLKPHHTDFPSIQGAWTPFVHKDPRLNILEYPPPTSSYAAEKYVKTGTEELLEIFQRQKRMEENPELPDPDEAQLKASSKVD